MEDENGVTRSSTEELQPSDLQQDPMRKESGVTRRIIHEV